MKKLILLSLYFCFSQIILSQQIYFPPISGDVWETTDPGSLNWNTEKISSLIDYVDSQNSKAFLILKDGKIVIEEYFDDFTKDDTWNWASAAKPITGFLTGVAQEKGLLSIDDPVSDYLGTGWTSAPSEKELLIKIYHQLTMTCGLEFEGEYGCTSPECLLYLVDAGTRWEYFGATYNLLSTVIEQVSGQDYNTFTNLELLSKIGMDGLWQTDEGYFFFSSKPRSMARFGLLMQNDGVWDNNIILGDRQYLDDSRETSQNMNLSYGYFWWLNGKSSFMFPGLSGVISGSMIPNAPDDLYAGGGTNSQLLFISPSQGLVIVRMGDQPVSPSNFLEDLWDKINLVIPTVNNQNINSLYSDISIYPNPFSSSTNINYSLEKREKVSLQVFNLSGQCISTIRENYQMPGEHEILWNASAFPAGVYIFKLQAGNNMAFRKGIQIK